MNNQQYCILLNSDTAYPLTLPELHPLAARKHGGIPNGANSHVFITYLPIYSLILAADLCLMPELRDKQTIKTASRRGNNPFEPFREALENKENCRTSNTSALQYWAELQLQLVQNHVCSIENE